MSDNDVRIIDEHLGHLDFEAERDQAVQLLADAAKQLTELAAAATPGVWRYERALSTDDHRVHLVNSPEPDEHNGTDVMETVVEADARWIAALSPTIAPFLAGWLSKVSSIAAGQQDREHFDLYVDLAALQLAQHVMSTATTDAAGE